MAVGMLGELLGQRVLVVASAELEICATVKHSLIPVSVCIVKKMN